MEHQRLKLGIIGATGTAYKRIIPSLVGSEHCDVSAIQGRDVEKLKNISKEFGIDQVFTDEDDIIESDCDIIYVATPPFMHSGSLQKIGGRGIPVICEKPLGIPLDNIFLLKDVFSTYTDSRFMLGHHLRHQKAIGIIRDKIIEIGKIRNVTMQWGYRINKNANNYSWKSLPGKGGDALFDVGSHMVDFSQLLFGNPNYVLKDRSNLVENSSFSLGYEGFEVNVHASHNSSYCKNTLLITGENGYIESEGFFGDQSARSIVCAVDGTIDSLNFFQENPYRNEIEDFCKCLKGILPSHHGTTLKEAIDSMQILSNKFT